MANGIQLLDHQLNQFGVVTVLDVLLRDPISKEPVLFLDTLKVSSISMEGNSKEIKGGIGANTLIEYDFGRTVNFEMQDAVASIESLATMWGAQYDGSLSAANVVAVLDLVTGEAGALTLPAGITVGALTDIKAYDASTGAQVTVSGTTAAPTAGSAAGVKIKAFIDGSVSTTATQLTVDGISVPPTVELVGTTFFIDRRSGKKMEFILKIPMLKINMGGGLSMEAEGDAAVFDFSGKALLDPVTKELFTLTRTGREFGK